ncbi:sensor histidine kinase [Dyadobacter subterraneus]|uniref:histidine kinase n=1 Tax=Dyadobacter subterraneus TaxID=2773304 RepID=A0ABR9WD63_9BACT|nr:HAMP domain-containing sensor histidine kinase [Dyadobacter subterraneus]MBE9463415.1 HAMP domain-containing histidine kinase [Dyadobacter subterraneus]
MKSKIFPNKALLDKYWIKLTGHPSEFPLNARIFHSACLISIAALIYNIPFNFFVGLPNVALACILVLIFCFGLYYNSRFLHRVKASIFISNFLGLGLFIFTYFVNSGLSGPSDQFFLLFLLLSISISPVEQYKIWVPLNIGIVMTLHLTEYFYPELFPNPYSSRSDHFIDQTSSYIEVALLFFFCTSYIRKSYEREKSSASIKTKSIEKKNLRIVKQNQELESLSAEKSKLMSIIAHDLRSPLSSIQNYLELLSAYGLNEAEKNDIEKDLLHATKDTLALLTKLLAWSKSQLHGIVAYPEYLNVLDLLSDTLEFEKTVASAKDILLDYSFDSELTIYADKDMMQLIIRNFVGNAIKFTHKGGFISVNAKAESGDCIISIKDTGIGIPVERQKDLFSLKAESTFGTKGEKGVGLGLLLCIEYINAQNGKIWFESTPDLGSCFYISVPGNAVISSRHLEQN